VRNRVLLRRFTWFYGSPRMNYPVSALLPMSSQYETVLQRLVHSRITARAARVSTHPMTTSTRSSGSLRVKCSGAAFHPRFQNKFSRFTKTTAL